MKSTIQLFKSVLISSNKKSPVPEDVLKRCIKHGYIITEEITGNYSGAELHKVLCEIESVFGRSNEELNSSFHKSWGKIKKAKIEDLVAEQVLHYFSTYGLESLGLYNSDLIYIPKEKLSIPTVNIDNISLVVIGGITKEELKDRLLKLLNSGIALAKISLPYILEIIDVVGISPEEVASIKNKEVKASLYDYLGIVPASPTEFLRYIIYKTTGKTLLIKNEVTINFIKENIKNDVVGAFKKYSKTYGLEQLSSIFYRFKPLFLAFKASPRLCSTINKLRKLAKKYHKPMDTDYLNNVTMLISRGDLDKEVLKKSLEGVNIFRKIRLAYALQYRLTDANSILYKIRNGKSYTKEYSTDPSKVETIKETLELILESIATGLNLSGKKVYIPDNISYTIPATAKQFIGAFPFGTSVKLNKNIMFGVCWNNVNGNRIDIDLSLINADGKKYGWDGSYRGSSDGSILFSGDMTDASNGASELFYLSNPKNKTYLMYANYFNYEASLPVPIKIFAAEESTARFNKNYLVKNENIKAFANGMLDQHQLIVGMLSTKNNETRFYFTGVNLGNSISSRGNESGDRAREYFLKSFSSPILLKDVLAKAGVVFVDRPEDSDINLNPENLAEDTIISLLTQ